MPKKSPVPDFGYTPEQIKEMQDFFKSNGFTANFSLQHEITLTESTVNEMYQNRPAMYDKMIL